ncbi:hypothetical protein [Streptomyces cinereoruber]|uniref:hypothetical protein n=1 Tax=Streptomyces cinereoruber TaxID=67260 RepID=UPI0036250519
MAETVYAANAAAIASRSTSTAVTGAGSATGGKGSNGADQKAQDGVSDGTTVGTS